MEHKDVENSIKNWLEEMYSSPTVIDTHHFVDCIVYTPLESNNNQYHLQVECKGAEDDIDKAVGQCLRYFTLKEGLVTYLAMPQTHWQLSLLLEMIKNTPIGLLSVTPSSIVKVKEASGKEITSPNMRRVMVDRDKEARRKELLASLAGLKTTKDKVVFYLYFTYKDGWKDVSQISKDLNIPVDIISADISDLCLAKVVDTDTSTDAKRFRMNELFKEIFRKDLVDVYMDKPKITNIFLTHSYRGVKI